jgi:hypothetical protein
VLTKIGIPNHHFSAFYEDNSILIQFIVEEFIHSYQLTCQIKALIQERLDSTETLGSYSLSLIQILGQLVGCLHHQERSSLSRWTRGSLTKFKEYCEQFSRNSSHQNKQHVNLHMAAHQAWLMATYNLELLNSLYTNPYIPDSKSILFLLPLKRSLQNLQMRFNQISRYIPRVLNEFWNDENVIYCLLRRKDLLVEIYGQDFMYKRLKWPRKTSEMIGLLVSRYQARGFEALLPSIQRLLESSEENEQNDEAH